jgi:hypothetical protein
MRTWWIVALGAVLVAGCSRQAVLIQETTGGSDPAVRIYEANGVHFEYPGTWLTFQASDASASAMPGVTPTGQDQREGVVGVDDLNTVSVLSRPTMLPSDDFRIWSGPAKDVVAEAFASGGVRILSGPEEIQAGGERALHYELRTSSGIGYVVDITWILFVRGSSEFIIRCQRTPERAVEIDRGCQQILASLEVG